MNQDRCSMLGKGGCAEHCFFEILQENANDIRNSDIRSAKINKLTIDAAEHGCPVATGILEKVQMENT